MATTNTVGSTTVDPNLLTTMNGSKATKGSVQEAQDRFMTLLVSQLRNQDPLNPMDNAQVTSQMAQLSTVSGIEKMNQTIETLNKSYQVSQGMQASQMIGHGVLVPGNSLPMASGKAAMSFELADAADTVNVTIRDGSGAIVRKLSAGAMQSGSNTVQWDGKDDNAKQLADGNYTYEVEATKADKKIVATQLAIGLVNSVSVSATGVKLAVSNIGDVDMNNVRKIF